MMMMMMMMRMRKMRKMRMNDEEDDDGGDDDDDDDSDDEEEGVNRTRRKHGSQTGGPIDPFPYPPQPSKKIEQLTGPSRFAWTNSVLRTGLAPHVCNEHFRKRLKFNEVH